ncbi:Arm DNA-binding domain-containing protein [Marisediminicola antarctica]|uniref:AP2-like integrase N-terminal domain-containing protein n=1 Tax=Marisediminicola antarctica TaxID=674079 RepID=A0A7L5AGK5_9MICO|nr:Arm DNA-binding domain-containing protein [Marisediminicola antarctica]QHO68885.1 hypothetical protein BHD05_03735 [Marisediminicola antarctica]
MGSISAYETSVGKRYRVRYRKPDHSQTDKRGFRTKREAEDFMASVEVSKLRGEWVDPTRSKMTVAEWAEHWYDARPAAGGSIRPPAAGRARRALAVPGRAR